jgi:membrane associated rhomboid family serine protease
MSRYYSRVLHTPRNLILIILVLLIAYNIVPPGSVIKHLDGFACGWFICDLLTLMWKNRIKPPVKEE